MSGGYDHLLTRFQDGVIQNEMEPLQDDIKQPPSGTLKERTDVYSQGYPARLAKAVEQDFPAVAYCVGEAPFYTMVHDYIAATPSTHYNLERYALGFPDFLKFTGSPHFVHQLATLEAAIRDVFLMPSSGALDVDFLKGQDAANFGRLQFLPRTASSLLTFDFPVNAYLTAFRNGEKPSYPREAASFTLVYRHQYEVRRHDFTLHEFQLFYRLANGMRVEEALEDCVKSGDVTEEALLPALPGWFQTWLASGMIRAAA